MTLGRAKRCTDGGAGLHPHRSTPPVAPWDRGRAAADRSRRLAAPGESRDPGDAAAAAPLAEPKFELHIDSATGQAYEVKAGDYIQIIDVAGRQCSDFLAFDARQLQQGRQRSFDMTATRTMTGYVYPGPGLFSKFFDVDLQPVLELVRDTVGRHDAFGLACTSKFYEDQGYPGHANCSDNFTKALQPFGVQPQRGWPCINLFYNTGIGAANAIFLDDPWSRPGDYVLFRATTDLVCASTACPDDIDATNAWNPTDIHVRVYPARNEFSRAIAYRMTPDSEAKLTRETPFHVRTSALTRNFTEYRGYWLPTKFNNHGAVDEYHACREGVVRRPLALAQVRGAGARCRDADAVACTRNMRRLAEGQAAYTALCYESGGMLDDAVAFRMGADRYRLDHRRRIHRQMAARPGGGPRSQGLGQILDGPALQYRGARAEEPRGAEGYRLDAAGPAEPDRDPMVPLHHRADRRSQRDSRRGLAHRLYRRAGLRNLLPSQGCDRRLGCGLRGRQAPGHRAAGPRGPGHAADRGGAHLRRL
jgi:Uncharacterized conserved protein